MSEEAAIIATVLLISGSLFLVGLFLIVIFRLIWRGIRSPRPVRILPSAWLWLLTIAVIFNGIGMWARVMK